MLHNNSDRLAIHAAGDRSLQIVLWAIWTLIVGGTAFFKWYTHIPTEQSIDLLSLIVYAALAELGGLIVLTLIEQSLAPYRFLD